MRILASFDPSVLAIVRTLASLEPFRSSDVVVLASLDPFRSTYVSVATRESPSGTAEHGRATSLVTTGTIHITTGASFVRCLALVVPPLTDDVPVVCGEQPSRMCEQSVVANPVRSARPTFGRFAASFPRGRASPSSARATGRSSRATRASRDLFNLATEAASTAPVPSFPCDRAGLLSSRARPRRRRPSRIPFFRTRARIRGTFRET